MSERGLRRKLAEHNTSFSKLLADVRRDRAADLINYTDLSIEEISVELGFADGRTFRQAF
jgi:transcriptional regulator GlxA family with amidase domain